MANSKTTYLNAVNSILSAAGETPVASLSENAGVDSKLAEQILDETSRNVQAQGWYFNTRETSLPVVNGTIPLNENVIRVDTDDYGATSYTIRSNKLFDLAAGSASEFTSAVVAKIVELLEWEDLPEAARQYITKKACRVYVDRHVSDPQMARLARQDEAEAHSILQRDEFSVGNYRIYDPVTAALVDRGGPSDWVRA